MPDKKDGFRDNTSSFFKRLQNQDLIKVGDNKITSLSQPASKDELKRRSEFTVFRQYLQQKNWSTKHLELFNEYRKMDDSFPIINAALRLYSQEICLSGDTILHTPMGDKSILELFNAGKSKTMFYVHTVDLQYKRTQWGMAKYIKYNGKKPVYEVVVDRNIDPETALEDKVKIAKFKCTENHKIMLPNGSFKMLNELVVGDSIFSFYKYTDPSCKCKEDRFQSSKITSIALIGEEDVYDLVNVEPYSHFSIKLTDSFYVQVHNCTKDDDGNVIKIHSKDKAIKESLEECFFKNLKLNSQAYLLVKEMIKFGNLYCYQNVRKGEGVTDLIHMPPEAIRIELLSNANNLDDFKYTWFGQSGGGMQFEPWELVHFRNIEDIEHQPYGTSILRSVVDTWRRIILMREALIIYRITRAPQRYLFKIDTTGMDPDAAILFSEEVKKQLYKKPMVNPFTGEIDFKYNPLSIEENFYMPTFEGDVGGIDVLQGACLKGDTIILTNSGEITIKELADKWSEGKKTFVLSSNKYGYITTGKVLNCKETKQTNTLYKIGINGTKFEESTDNHPFLLESLDYKRADELQVGDKLKGMFEKEYIVSSVEIVTYDSPESVYDLEVAEHHNFALLSGIFVHNSNLSDVEDYKIIKDDLFAGLLIPKSYLTFEEDLSNKAALAQEDMRFAGAIKQYQGNFVEGLLHIALVHLHTQGFSPEDLENFEIEMNTNSKLLKKLENETLQQQVDLAKSILDTSNGELTLMSYTQVLKDVMKYSDEQIAQSFENQLLEKKINWRLSQLKENGFFEEPVEEKKQAMMKRLGDEDIFSKLQFEGLKNLPVTEKILTEKVKQEIAALVKPVKAKASKRMINKLIDLNPTASQIVKVTKALGLRD